MDSTEQHATLPIVIRVFSYFICCIVVLFITNTHPVLILHNPKNWLHKYAVSEWSSMTAFNSVDCNDTIMNQIANKNRAMYTSSGEFGSITNVLTTLYQLRHKCANEVIVVAHCQEISARTAKFLLTIKSVVVSNVCARLSASQLVRFRSFFCKFLMIVHSKHRHFVMIDVDVVWFRSPNDLTDDLISRNVSAFFFHDHAYYLGSVPELVPHNPDKQILHFTNKPQLVTFLRQYMTDDEISENKFLRLSNIMNRLANIEVDASYVYYNAENAKAALKLINDWKYSFNFGFADQEIYWLVSVIANLKIGLDPWRTSAYCHEDLQCAWCNCHNHQLHYHPFQSAPGLFHGNGGPLHEVQIEPTEKSKFVHINCPQLPLLYTPNSNLDYVKKNIMEFCFLIGTCIRYEQYNNMSIDLLTSLVKLRQVNIMTSSIEYALHGIV